MLGGKPAAEAADEVEAALAAGPPADPYSFGTAIELLVRTERDDAAGRWLALAIDAARAYGLVLRLAGLHAQRALMALGQGAVGEAEVDVQTALRLAGERHFMIPRIVGLGIQVALERGEREAAAEVAERYGGDALARERILLTNIWSAAANCSSPGATCAMAWRISWPVASCSTRTRSRGRPTGAPTLRERSPSSVTAERAERLAREGVAAARAFGAPRALARSLRAAGRVIGGEEGLDLLEEAVSIVEPSPARLEAAHALADLGAELVERAGAARAGRRFGWPWRSRRSAGHRAGRTRPGRSRRGRGSSAATRAHGVEALTPAERKVCDLAAASSPTGRSHRRSS